MSSARRLIFKAPRGRRVHLAKLAIVAGAYFGTAKLGLALAFEHSSVTAVWPPTGIALAATLLWGYRVWPGIALGALLANSWTGVPLITVLGITTGNTLEAIVGAYLLRRVAFRPSLERLRDVVALFALAALLSTAVSATIGVTSLYVGDRLPIESIAAAWRTWWLGDMGGDLLVAPVLLLAAGRPRLSLNPRRVLEAALLLAALVAAAGAVFSMGTPITYLLFPPLLWGALRFRQVGAALSSLIVAGIAVGFTASGSGPFTQSSTDSALILCQTFMGVAAVTALLLAAVTSEESRARARLRKVQEGLEAEVIERTAELERSNAELALQAEIVANIAEGVVLVSAGGTIAYANATFEEMFGYASGELTGRPVSVLNASDGASPEETAAEIISALERQGAWSGEIRNVKKDGTPFRSHAEVSAFQHPLLGGRVWVSVQRDITERRRTQEELRVRESQLADAQRVAHIGSWEWNIPANEIRWSDELYRIHGLDPDRFEASYEAFLEGIHADDREVVDGIVKKAFGDGQPFDYYHRCVRPNGEVRMLHAQGRVERDEGGRPVRMLGICQDVTELKRMEAPQRLLAAIVESSQDAILSKSPEGMITSWNPGAARLLGYEPEEIVGRPITVLVPPERRSEEVQILASVFAGKGVVNYETQRRRKDQALVDVSVTVSPIKDGDGAIVGCSSITRDITERKRIQEEADRLKDEFFATVSHELRTPLTSIIGYTDLLLSAEGGELTDQQRRFLEVTERNAKRQLRLVGDMLFVSQAEAGEFSIELGSVDLAWVVGGCVEAAKPAAEQRAIELVHSGAYTPECEADGDRIAQLADNLISNAIKFTPQGGEVRVDVSLGEGSVVLEVANSGSYISPTDQERLFDRFFRTSAASDNAVQGVGLGLTIAEAIVRAHGGKIEVRSDPQTGTVFRVRLPLREPSKVIDLAQRRKGAAA